MGNSRLKRIMSGLFASALALTLCMSSAMPVSAEPLPNGTVGDPATAAITKELQMPQGTEAPTATFTFNIVKVSVDGDDSSSALTSMPSLTGSVTVSNTTYSSLNGDVKSVIANTGDILAGNTWTQAGEYIYNVTEAASGYTISDPAKETLVYSLAEYELHVFIAEDNGVLYVKSAGVNIIKDQSGNPVSGEKIDPTVPGVSGNNFRFVNTYTKTKGGGEITPDPLMQSFSISKAVAGDMASTTKYFPFEVKLTNNSLITTPTYKAYICTLAAGAYTPETAANVNNQYDTGQNYITFTEGTAKTVNLKAGQYLVFMECPQGTIYAAIEGAVAGYIARVDIVTGGVAISDSNLINTTANTALSTGNRIVTGDTTSSVNTADFTNTYASTIPTGIIINNLPFIIMILAAVAMFTGYIVSKRRKMAR